MAIRSAHISLPFILAWLGVSSTVTAQYRTTPEQVTRNLPGDSVEIPNARSPNGKLALFSVYLDGTTGAVVGIVTTDRKRCFAVTSSHPYGANVRDRTPKSYLTVLWSSNSTHVAIHDSASKHSRLQVFVLDDSGGRQVALPHLLPIMIADGTVASPVVSSGEEPLEWIDDNRLLVEFRSKTDSGERVSRRITIDTEKGTASNASPENALDAAGNRALYTTRLTGNTRYGLSVIASNHVVSAVKIIEFVKDDTFIAVPQSCSHTPPNKYNIVWDERVGTMIGLKGTDLEVGRIDEGKTVDVRRQGETLILRATHRRPAGN